MHYVNENIKNTERIFPQEGRYGFLRLDMNENPEGLPREIVDKFKESITPEFLSVYPEPTAFQKKYAKFIGVSPENVVTSNGSDMAIRYALETFAQKGHSVVTVTPSFEMYRVNCMLLGLNHVPVSYENDFTINIQNILDAIDSNTDITVLLNPNNPIGNAYTEEEARKIIEKSRKFGAVVIIDEAYHYFYPNTFLPLALEYDNVLILRTFSKLFSMASLRLGIVIGNEKLIHYIRNIRLTFDANALALKLAEMIIDEPGLSDRLIQTEREGRAYVKNALLKAGYEIFEGNGNFIFFRPKREIKSVEKALFDKKILVKTYGNPMLKDWIRISTGSKKSMEKFMDALLEVDRTGE